MRFVFAGEAYDSALTVIDGWGRSLFSDTGYAVRVILEDDTVLHKVEVIGVGWADASILLMVSNAAGQELRTIPYKEIREIYVY